MPVEVLSVEARVEHSSCNLRDLLKQRHIEWKLNHSGKKHLKLGESILDIPQSAGDQHKKMVKGLSQRYRKNNQSQV